MKLRKESWAMAWPEIKLLLDTEHRKETNSEELINAKIDILKYQLLDTQQKLCIITLRDGVDQLRGYHVSTIDTHLNMVNYKFAFVTMYFVSHGARGKGFGKQLFSFAEAELRKHGVYAIWAASKLEPDNSPMLRSVGYDVHEIMFVKWLQAEPGEKN